MLKKIKPFLLGTVAGAIIAATAGVALAVNFTMVLSQNEVDLTTWKWNAVDPSHTAASTVQIFGENAVRTYLLAEWRNQRMLRRVGVVGAPLGYMCLNVWPGLSQPTKDGVCTSTYASGGLGEIAGCTPCDPAGN